MSAGGNGNGNGRVVRVPPQAFETLAKLVEDVVAGRENVDTLQDALEASPEGVHLLRVVPVDAERGHVRVEAHLTPELVRRALANGDGGPVVLAITQGLLRGLVRTAPPPVAAVLKAGIDTISEGMAALEVDG